MAKGIYCIRNNTTDERYVGSSVDMDVRWLLHKTKLNRNCHHAGKLQRAWNTYGPDGFAFEIIECVADPQNKTLVLREQHWIDHYDSYRHGYNSTPVASRPLTLTDEERGLRAELMRYGLYEPKYIQNLKLHNPLKFDADEQRKWEDQFAFVSKLKSRFVMLGWMSFLFTLVLYFVAAHYLPILLLLLPLAIWPIILLGLAIGGRKHGEWNTLRTSEPKALAKRAQDDLVRVERQGRKNGPRVRMPRRRGHYWY